MSRKRKFDRLYKGWKKFFITITQKDIDDCFTPGHFDYPHFIAIRRKFKNGFPLPACSNKLSSMINDWDCNLFDTFKPGTYAIWIENNGNHR